MDGGGFEGFRPRYKPGGLNGLRFPNNRVMRKRTSASLYPLRTYERTSTGKKFGK
jgi:hypothetical protein